MALLRGRPCQGACRAGSGDGGARQGGGRSFARCLHIRRWWSRRRDSERVAKLRDRAANVRDGVLLNRGTSGLLNVRNSAQGASNVQGGLNRRSYARVQTGNQQNHPVLATLLSATYPKRLHFLGWTSSRGGGQTPASRERRGTRKRRPGRSGRRSSRSPLQYPKRLKGRQRSSPSGNPSFASP